MSWSACRTWTASSVSLARSRRSRCHRSCARACACSSSSTTERTWLFSRSSSRPEKSRRSSTGATPCVKSLKPSVIRGKDTLGGRSSSRSEMQAAAQMAASPLAWPERSVNCARSAAAASRETQRSRQGPTSLPHPWGSGTPLSGGTALPHVVLNSVQGAGAGAPRCSRAGGLVATAWQRHDCFPCGARVRVSWWVAPA
jgi:hypothetical protein